MKEGTMTRWAEGKGRGELKTKTNTKTEKKNQAGMWGGGGKVEPAFIRERRFDVYYWSGVRRGGRRVQREEGLDDHVGSVGAMKWKMPNSWRD